MATSKISEHVLLKAEELPTLSLASVIAPSSGLTFNNIPTEMREMIWKATYEPKTIRLHVNTHTVTYPQKTNMYTRSQAKEAAAAAAAANNGVADPTEQLAAYSFSASALKNNTDAGPYLTEQDLIPLSPTVDNKLELPVAMLVCKESRQIAMRTYKAAFGGVLLLKNGSGRGKKDKRVAAAEKKWEASGLARKNIWVDFNSDVIFLDSYKSFERSEKHGVFIHPLARKQIDPPTCSPLAPYECVAKHATIDAHKIKLMALRLECAQPIIMVTKRLLINLPIFSNLTSVTIHDCTEDAMNHTILTMARPSPRRCVFIKLSWIHF